MDNRQNYSLLFPDVGHGWRKSFSRCNWLNPHYFPFKNIDKIIEYCISHQIKSILPVSLKSHRFLIKHQTKLKKENIEFLANNLVAIDCFGDKKLFYEFMIKNKLGTYMPIHYKDIRDVQYPCVVKSIAGSFGRGQRVVLTADELGNINDDELLSEYIEGNVEYATDILYNNRRIICHSSRIYHFDDKYYIAGQAKRQNIQVVSCDNAILDIFNEILRIVDYSGFCCVNYKIVDNKPILFEINARIGYFLTRIPSELKKMTEMYIDESFEVPDVSINDYQEKEIQSLMLLLAKVDKNYVSIRNTTLYSDLYNPHTKTLSIKKLQCSGPSISNQELDALKIVHHINGSISLSGNSRLTSLDGLNNIRTISGSLMLHNTGIEEIDGLNEIVELGSLIISDNPQLNHINGFTALRIIRNSLSIKNNQQLIKINGINSLKKITAGDLELSNNPRLVKINGLIGILSVGRSLILENCINLTDIFFLSSLKTVHNILFRRLKLTSAAPLRQVFKNSIHFKGYIKIIHCPLSNVTFMRGMKSVGSSFYLHNNQLSDLSGLDDLERVGASFSLLKNRLKDISQLAGLKEINGMLGLAYNQLTTLHGLENLEHVRIVRWDGHFCSLNISGNPQLNDIGALSNIKGNGNNIIMLMDKHQDFARIPEFDSVFSYNTIQVLAPDFSRIPDKLPMSAEY
jgi:hypothetical protein